MMINKAIELFLEGPLADMSLAISPITLIEGELKVPRLFLYYSFEVLFHLIREIC